MFHKVNAGIIGTGLIARTMADTLGQMRNVRCYAVASRTLERAGRIRQKKSAWKRIWKNMNKRTDFGNPINEQFLSRKGVGQGAETGFGNLQGNTEKCGNGYEGD